MIKINRFFNQFWPFILLDGPLVLFSYLFVHVLAQVFDDLFYLKVWHGANGDELIEGMNRIQNLVAVRSNIENSNFASAEAIAPTVVSALNMVKIWASDYDELLLDIINVVDHLGVRLIGSINLLQEHVLKVDADRPLLALRILLV